MTGTGVPPPPPGTTAESLWAPVCELRTRVEQLEAQAAPPDSRPSSAPSSTDGPKSRSERRAEARERRKSAEARGVPGRRPAEQPGAPGAHRTRAAAPDVVVVHEPVTAPTAGPAWPAPRRWERCAARARRARAAPGRHRAPGGRAALPPVRAGRHRRVPRGRHRAGAVGPGVAALGAYLHHAHAVPYERAAQFLADCSGAGVSTGWLVGVSRRLADRLGPFEAAVEAAVRARPPLHADEAWPGLGPGARSSTGWSPSSATRSRPAT